MPDQSTIALILFGGLAVLILLRVPLGFFAGRGGHDGLHRGGATVC